MSRPSSGNQNLPLPLLCCHPPSRSTAGRCGRSPLVVCAGPCQPGHTAVRYRHPSPSELLSKPESKQPKNTLHQGRLTMPSARSMETPLGLFWNRGVYPYKRQYGYCHRKRPDAPLVPSLISSSQDGLGFLLAPFHQPSSPSTESNTQGSEAIQAPPSFALRPLARTHRSFSGLTRSDIRQLPTHSSALLAKACCTCSTPPSYLYHPYPPSLQRNNISSLASARPLHFTPPETVLTIFILSSITSPYTFDYAL